MAKHNFDSKHIHNMFNACRLIKQWHSLSVHGKALQWGLAYILFPSSFIGRSSWTFINEAGGLPYEPVFVPVWPNLWDGIVVYPPTIPTIPPPGVLHLCISFPGQPGLDSCDPESGAHTHRECRNTRLCDWMRIEILWVVKVFVCWSRLGVLWRTRKRL